MFNMQTLLGMLGNVKPEDLQKMAANLGNAAQTMYGPNASPAIPTARPSNAAPASAPIAPAAAMAPPSAAPMSGGPMAALKGLLDFGEKGSDRRQDLTSGLLAFGSAMSQAGAPSFDPGASSFSAALGKGTGAFGESMAASKDARAKRTFMEGQTAAQDRNADPAYLAQRALAGQGVVQGEDGQYGYAPGYGELLAEQKRQETLAATQATSVANLENDRRALRDHELQVERGEIDASRRAANRSLSSTEMKAIDEARASANGGETLIRLIDEALAANSERYYGPTAGARAAMGRFLGDTPISDESAGLATTNYNNLISSQVVAQLKTAFGGVISDSERSYIEDNIVASVEKSPAEAKVILDRLRRETEMANAFNTEKAEAIAGGSWYAPNGAEKTYRPESLLEGYNAPPVAPASTATAPAAPSDGIPVVTGPNDPVYLALPNGAKHRLPSGRIYQKR